jgi:hypothetical protein
VLAESGNVGVGKSEEGVAQGTAKSQVAMWGTSFCTQDDNNKVTWGAGQSIC